MSNVDNVTTGKPKVGGAIFVAPMNEELPKDASSELSSKYKSMGYISEDGLTNSNSPSSENVKAWGGDIVMTSATDKPDTFKYTLIESLNPEVLKHVYGSDNVSGDIASGITIKANNNLQEGCIVVIDMILKGGILKRIVVPKAYVTAVEDISYADNKAVSYGTTISALPDADGNTHYEYIYKKNKVETSESDTVTNGGSQNEDSNI